MKLLFSVKVKNFFGIYVLTPFENELLKRLSEALNSADRDVLAYQLAHFTTVRRLITHIDVPKAHGFTNFHTLRFGRSVSAERQVKKFASDEAEALLATAHVVFEDGEIDVQFWLVRGVLFRIEYRSPQKIYYPPDKYLIETLVISTASAD